LANEYVVEYEHPIYGMVKMIGLPHKFSDTPSEPKSAAPQFGQHTEEVLLELGYNWAEITELKNAEVI